MKCHKNLQLEVFMFTPRTLPFDLHDATHSTFRDQELTT